MTPLRAREHPRSAAVRARDGALRRLTVLNRLAAVGSVALVLAFTALAAKATPPRQHAVARVVVPAVGHVSDADRSPRHHRGERDRAVVAQSQAPAAASGATPSPAPAPAPMQQRPVVVSGGS